MYGVKCDNEGIAKANFTSLYKQDTDKFRPIHTELNRHNYASCAYIKLSQ